MSKEVAAIYAFIILFIIFFLCYYYIVNKRYLNSIKKKKKKKIELIELTYLTKKFNLDEDKLPLNKILICTAIFNSLIISLTSVIIILINVHISIKLLIGLALVFALIYAIYELFGRYLVKKGYGKNEHKRNKG